MYAQAASTARLYAFLTQPESLFVFPEGSEQLALRHSAGADGNFVISCVYFENNNNE
jgi:hypothetical protein